VKTKELRKIKSPTALAAFGAFFVPEPLGVCFVLIAGLWWWYRKLNRGVMRCVHPADEPTPVCFENLDSDVLVVQPANEGVSTASAAKAS
jgi:hypothetical protein